MSAPRRTAIALLLSLVPATALTLPASAQATGGWPAWDGDATGEFRSWVIDDGELAYSNGIFQSRGANADGLHHEDYWSLLVTGGELPIDERDDVENHLTWGAFGADRFANDGDQELPLDEVGYPSFTGELAELRVAVDDDEVFLRFLWTSMPTDDQQIATLTFSAPGTTVAGTWPHGAEVSSPWDVAVTTWGTGASLTNATAGVAGTPTALDAGAVRIGDHTVEVRVPRTSLPAGPWTLRGGGGLTDPTDRSTYWAVPAGSATETSPASGGTLAAGSPVWSLLFAAEQEWVFTARAEGDLLVAGDVTEAAIVLDPAVLDAGGDLAQPPTSGRLSRFHSSAHDFGDGILKGAPGSLPSFLMIPPEVPLDDAARSYEYTGRLQPYGMIVPEAYHERTEPWPLVVYLHGLNNYYYEPFGVLQGLDQHVTDNGFLFAGLLGRGDISYLGRGELEVREALADITAAYDVDPDRIHFMGHSMGSIGTHNFVTRNPDLVASASPAEITASDGLLSNLMHVPWMTAGGIQDPLDAFAQSEIDTHNTLAGLGYDSTSYLFLAKTHEASSMYDLLPQTFAHFNATRRVTDPGTFTYRRLANDDDPDLGVLHDAAYAASSMVFADPDSAQQIDVTSFAIPHAPLDPAAGIATDGIVDEGGPSNRSVARKLTFTPAFGAPYPVSNSATATLANMSGVTLDLDRLALARDVGMTVNVTTDVPTSLVLTGVADPAAVAAELDGVVVVGAVTTSAITLAVPAGEHEIVLVAAAAQAPTEAPTTPATDTLPATGGGLVAMGLIALTGSAVLRRRA